MNRRFTGSLFVLWFALTTPAISQAADTCQLVFDAGSSGTRLYAYENTTDGLKEIFPNPITIDIGVSWALEKKQCGEQACTDTDIEQAVAGLIREFHQHRTDHCAAGITAVSLYATAGMRLAAQKRGRQSLSQTYQQLKSEILKTFASLGDAYPEVTKDNITVRTLSGQEEGIYTWLTINSLKNNRIDLDGIFEVGGASLQLAYPCTDYDQVCLQNSVRVSYKGRGINLFSYSWLGLGRTEAYRIFNAEKGFPCNSVADSKNGSPFNLERCRTAMASAFSFHGKDEFTLRDPLNYNAFGVKGYSVAISIPPGTEFHGAGGIGYENLKTLKQDATEICNQTVADLIAHQEDKFESIRYTPESLLHSQCFARLYFDTLLDNIPGLTLVSNNREINGVKVGWTLGAAICEQTGCIDKKNLSCRWNRDSSCTSETH